MGMTFRTVAAVLALVLPGWAARLTQPANQAFDAYAAGAEKRLAQQHASPTTFLAALGSRSSKPDAQRQLEAGTLLMEPMGGGTRPVSGGLLHHWRGVALVPGGRAADMLDLLRDYDRLSAYYAPEVESSRLVSERNGAATVAIRFRKQVVVPIVLDTEYEIHNGLLSSTTGYSISRSTHVWEVESPGTSRERRMKEGDDDGYLWRLNTYWSFIEVPGGLVIECEAISLTRDIPAGLGWLVTPVIDDMPRNSLKFTLTATRNALSSVARKEAHK